MTQILRIAARVAGFRRCGVAHPAALTDHPRDRFSEDEIARLKADPMLVVEEIDAGERKGGKAAAPAPEPSREERIRAAMRDLDRETRPDLFTGSGKPKTEALQERTGLETIKAAERDALWAEILAEKG